MKRLNLARAVALCFLTATAPTTLAHFPDLSGTYHGEAVCNVSSYDPAESGTRHYPVDIVIEQLGNPPWVRLHLWGLWTGDFDVLVPNIQDGMIFPDKGSSRGTVTFAGRQFVEAPYVAAWGVTQLQYHPAHRSGNIVLTGTLTGLFMTYDLPPYNAMTSTCTLEALQTCSGNACWQ